MLDRWAEKLTERQAIADFWEWLQSDCDVTDIFDAPVALAREAMGIDWTNRRELAEAIPPAYSEYLGRQVMAYTANAGLDRQEESNV